MWRNSLIGQFLHFILYKTNVFIEKRYFFIEFPFAIKNISLSLQKIGCGSDELQTSLYSSLAFHYLCKR